MKRIFTFLLVVSFGTTLFAQMEIKAPGVKWDESYSFDKCNVLKIEFYAKNNELMKTVNYKTYYQSSGENFDVTATNPKGKDFSETIFDKKNMVAIQVYKSAGVFQMCNAGQFKYPAEDEIKRLDLVTTNETKQIAGYNCKRYTYTYKKIFGEVWITDEVKLSNDYGIFRAAKMSALHNTLSVGGFVMEMTTEDSRGGKTLMTTVSLFNDEKYTTDFKGAEMTTAINKVNYFTF
jgi:GLPGLI family protein